MTSPDGHQSRRKRRPRLWQAGGIACLAMVGGAELFARYYLGLGDPPLMIEDPQIEYMFKPSASYKRFGHQVRYNAYGMRSDEFPKRKEQQDEVRILFIGDSIMDGGVQVDQQELATELVRKELSEVLAKPVVVGNASAKSWGPPNMLAYVKRYGFFDADVCVVVLSSHDVMDIPSFTPIVGVNPDFPAEKPVLAVEEALTRYLPRYIPALRKPVPAEIPDAVLIQNAEDESMKALGSLLQAAKASGASILLAQHMEKAELLGGAGPGHERIASVAEGCDVPVVQLGAAIRACQTEGREPYLDFIHLTPAGQAAMAKTLTSSIVEALNRKNAAIHALGRH